MKRLFYFLVFFLIGTGTLSVTYIYGEKPYPPGQIAVEKVQLRESFTNQKGTITITALADFAGVHPITITRNLDNTLVQSGGNSKKFSRATKKTAIALFERLSINSLNLRKQLFLDL